MIKTYLKLPAGAIGKRLILRVLLFAVLLIVLSAGMIGWITHAFETRSMEQQFRAIEKNYLGVIEAALWVDDRDILGIVLESICRTPGIEYAAIDSKENLICKAGNPSVGNELERIYPILHRYNQKTYTLGELHVTGSAEHIRGKTVKAAMFIMLAQASIIILICALLLLLLYRIVIGRLLRISSYTASLSWESLDTTLVLDPTGGNPDEIDHLAEAINRMRENLHRAFARKNEIEEELKHHQNSLEMTVAQRTASLKTANERLQSEINERIKMEQEREGLIRDLEYALSEVKNLSGLLPICAHCKNIRDDKGFWQKVEKYIQDHSEAEFSHSICPECAKKLYPDLDIYKE